MVCHDRRSAVHDLLAKLGLGNLPQNIGNENVVVAALIEEGGHLNYMAKMPTQHAGHREA